MSDDETRKENQDPEVIAHGAEDEEAPCGTHNGGCLSNTVA
jgi:hypothetical protein